MSKSNYLWVETYRPKSVEECVLPEELKKTFLAIVASKEIPNMILCGSAGCGKTTVARAICNELDVDYLFINASENGNIDTLRTKVRDFASSVSFSNSKKVVILDEADYLNPNSTQPSLRGFIEEFASNCRFILTCNFKNRIIEPLHSRCAVIEFKIPKKEKAKLSAEMFKRVCGILTTEKIKFEPGAVAELISKHFPDYRRILGELQRYSSTGTIDSGVLVKYGDIDIKSLIDLMKSKNFTEVRKWVAVNTDVEHSVVFRKLYDGLVEYIEPQTIPAVVMVLAEYQYKMAFSTDHEICMSACLAELMLSANFR